MVECQRRIFRQTNVWPVSIRPLVDVAASHFHPHRRRIRRYPCPKNWGRRRLAFPLSRSWGYRWRRCISLQTKIQFSKYTGVAKYSSLFVRPVRCICEVIMRSVWERHSCATALASVSLSTLKVLPNGVLSFLLSRVNSKSFSEALDTTPTFL